MRAALCLALMATSALADVYMHNMRGSNDRLNEANTNRNNGNRLFDSQNNDKGGYCYTLGTPPMSYYEGSLLPLEWTAQHGCGNPKMECNMVLQYMCGNQIESDPTIQIRDGTTTQTIPDNVNNFNQKDAATGMFTFGMHESYAYYQNCKTRQRNMGLFIADRNKNQNQLTTNKQSAIFTRQNNNGNRNGFECPEERDYYPYWHPSPWKDIAVLANDVKQCSYYQAESQNVKSRNQCVDSTGKPTAPNNKNACVAAGNTWSEVSSWGIPAPECVQAPWSRDNHLGNALGTGEQASYNWTLPTASQEPCIANNECTCVLRLRYNISTGDIDGWGYNDFYQNGVGNSPVTQDPNVQVMGKNLTLAMDTTQFGRTFQDRSHTFSIRPRPSDIHSYDRIYNLNVRGKRGNIVQTYPATEYDFVPTQLTTRQNDYIHFQWTGCDNNPANNAGEGTAGTDRSNIVQITDPSKNFPAGDDWYGSNTPLFEASDLRTRMAHLDQVNCLTYDQLIAKNGAGNTNAIKQDPQNCMKLNAASPYFDGGLVKMNKTGTFYYMSSRNNNFSNRGQKATITVEAILPTWAIVLVSVGSAAFVVSGVVGGMTFYAKSHPHTPVGSSINNLLSKLRV
eukprot:TRINITY_DN7192_c0_g1_i2.p2 TRINITY_DN7192_c0_g1~~TRINITY_DN7192_c0_g1_i2.p2  ORF type:complete len:621 (+),score=251.49 TRINITY_DN7192_c0_g1_i2:102-1964(+)